MLILHSRWRQSNEWTEMRMFELKISKNNILLYLLQIYIFAVIAWDYEIFYQIPLLLLFIATMLRYGQVARAIRTSSFFHGYFLMMMYFFSSVFVRIYSVACGFTSIFDNRNNQCGCDIMCCSNS